VLFEPREKTALPWDKCWGPAIVANPGESRSIKMFGPLTRGFFVIENDRATFSKPATDLATLEGITVFSAHAKASQFAPIGTVE